MQMGLICSFLRPVTLQISVDKHGYDWMIFWPCCDNHVSVEIDSLKVRVENLRSREVVLQYKIPLSRWLENVHQPWHHRLGHLHDRFIVGLIKNEVTCNKTVVHEYCLMNKAHVLPHRLRNANYSKHLFVVKVDIWGRSNTHYLSWGV